MLLYKLKFFPGRRLCNVTSYEFAYADNGRNRYLYDKKADPAHCNPDLHSNDIAIGANQLCLEVDGSIDVKRKVDGKDKSYANFVGFGDEWDYAEIRVSAPGTLTFTVDAFREGTVAKASPNLKFTVYSLTRVVKGKDVTWKQKTLLTQTITVDRKTGYVEAAEVRKSIVLKNKDVTSDDVRCFVSVQSVGAKKGAEVYYNVTAEFAPLPAASALAMPETDSLAITDALDFGRYAAEPDALAGPSLSDPDISTLRQSVDLLA